MAYDYKTEKGGSAGPVTGCVALGCDHGGYELKEEIKKYLEEAGIACKDFGCNGTQSCDYPDYGMAAAKAVVSGECVFGIVLCTTGVGICITANKIRGIRCALCADPVSARLTREHNDANMLALGAGIVGKYLAFEIVDTFLHTDFSGEGKHCRRIGEIAALEEETMK